MKILIFILLLGCAAALAGTTNTLRLAWDYPTNAVTDDLGFVLRQSTTLSLPLINWTNTATLSATNLIGMTNATVASTNYVFVSVITNTPGQMFYYAAATNMWGESDPSNVAASPPLPLRRQLKIEKTP
jgi:hypothetical protein